MKLKSEKTVNIFIQINVTDGRKRNKGP